jgi:LCP family protein required for cell wall assembly
MKNKKKKGSGLRSALIALCVIQGLVLLVFGGLTGAIYYYAGRTNQISHQDQSMMTPEEAQQYLATEETEIPDPDFSGPTMGQEDVDWGNEEEAPVEKTEQIINILLIGQDRRPGEGRSRSDTMILCTVNKEAGTLTLTSFMRDLYVQIPGYGSSKMNAAYVWGGMALLNQTIEKNFGIHIDGNVEVDFSQFANIVDQLGGVELELRRDEANWINGAAGYGQLTAGLQRMDGTQTMLYSRIRSLDPDADFSRTNRQRKVINAIVTQTQDSSLTELLKLLDEILPMFTTDMSSSQIIGYATDLFPMLSGITVVSQRVPADGMYRGVMIDGMACLVADMDATRQMLRQTLGG